MADKEFRRLNRAELIEILYEVQKQSDEKSAQIEQLQKELDDKTLRISKAGSIAEASIQVSGVFEAAQEAADRYLSSVRQAEAAQAKKQVEAEQKRQKMLREASAQAEELIRLAETEAQKILASAEQGASEKWKRFEQRAEELIAAHAELRALMGESQHQ